MALGSRRAGIALVVLAVTLPATGGAQERVGPGNSLTDSGRKLAPVGRMTPLGAFPTGGALTPDGRFYWAVDAGRGANASGSWTSATGAGAPDPPLPGGYVGIAFSPGRQARLRVRSARRRAARRAEGRRGDVIHVYDVDPRTGAAAELDPIALPDARDGAAAQDELPPAIGVNAWPEGHGRDARRQAPRGRARARPTRWRSWTWHAARRARGRRPLPLRRRRRTRAARART